MRTLCFGEMLLRLSPADHLRIEQASAFDARYGGAEANVALSLALQGDDAAYLSVIPANRIGDCAVRSLAMWGVDTSRVIRSGDRLGVYFMEFGASERPNAVVYDRKYSAIAGVKPGDIDWDKVFDGAAWFHWTGITPALSDSAAEVTLEACKAAKAKGLTISCDLNYRKKLWTREKAKKVMTELCSYVDVMIANEEDSKDVFGIEAEGTDIETGKLSEAGYRDLAKKLAAAFGAKKVAFTLRESFSANDNNWSALLYDAASDTAIRSRQYAIRIVDRVGGGDSFGGGLIYSLMNGYSDEEAINFAAAASALKHTIEGDFNRVTLDEVEKLMGGSASGRVQR